MINKRFLKDAKAVFNELQKQTPILTPEEEELFKSMSDRLNVEYESHVKSDEKAKKTTRKVVYLDAKTMTFANQALLLRAVMSSDISQRETVSEFVKKLILEEWSRLNGKFEAIQRQIDEESAARKK